MRRNASTHRRQGARLQAGHELAPETEGPLTKLVLIQTHALDLDKLFDGTTDASATGKIRKAGATI